jgi:cysteine synthase
MVRLNRLVDTPDYQLYLKLERHNPFGSVKDRVALEMLRDLESAGRTVIEASSGNTGLALAGIAATMGIPVEIAVPEGVPEEKKAMLRLLGVRIWETDDALCPRFPSEGARGLVDAMVNSPATRDHYLSPNQYESRLNVQAHYRHTGPEIRRQAAVVGTLTHFFAGFGTCGTISGVGRYLKKHSPAVRVIGVEPSSPAHKLPGLKRITGLPEELVPGILDLDVVDARESVTDEEAYDTAIALARREGILVGPTTGAIVAAALRHAAKGPGMGAVIAPDDAFKYGQFYTRYLDDKEAKSEH